MIINTFQLLEIEEKCQFRILDGQMDYTYTKKKREWVSEWVRERKKKKKKEVLCHALRLRGKNVFVFFPVNFSYRNIRLTGR